VTQKKKQIPKQDSIKRYTITAMKELGTHKVQYNRIIDIYAGLVHQYLIALRDFEEGGYKYEVETGTGEQRNLQSWQHWKTYERTYWHTPIGCV